MAYISFDRIAQFLYFEDVIKVISWVLFREWV